MCRAILCNYNLDNLFDRQVESITWIESQTFHSTSTKLYGVGMECLKNSFFACGRTDLPSNSECSRIDTAAYEKRWVEEGDNSSVLSFGSGEYSGVQFAGR